jgi:hypothetical protein
MFCGILDEMKTTIVLFFALVFLAIIIYYFNDKIQYLEHAVSRQNQVLSDFISNVQREVVNSPSLGVSNSGDIKIVRNDEMDKIVISEDEYDSDSESDDSDSDSDDSDDDDDVRSGNDNKSIIDNKRSVNESENNEENKKNIKVIELIDEDLQEMHNDDLLMSNISANVKKIDIKDHDKDKDKDKEDGDTDIVGSKKMSVGELRALVVSKGLATQANANKLKKLELTELLDKANEM